MQSTSPDVQENCSGEQVGGSEEGTGETVRLKPEEEGRVVVVGCLTSTGELVLQQHQVDGTRAASRPVALHNADVGAAAVVPGARVFTCRSTALMKSTGTLNR